MARFGLTKARSLGPIVDAVERAGGNVARVFSRAEVPLGITDYPERLIPLRSQLRLLEFASQEVGDPVLPARLSLKSGVAGLGVLGERVLAAERLEAAIFSANQLMGSLLQSCTRIDLTVRDDVARWSYSLTDCNETGRQKNEFLALGYMTDLIRSFLGRNWTPLRAVVSGSQIEARSEAERTLGAALVLGTEAVLYFPADQLDALKPVRSEPPATPDCSDAPIGDDLLTCIEHLVLLELLDGRPTIDRVARRLGLPRRTLQRRLAERGTSFDKVLTVVLERQAEMLLSLPEMSLSQIALHLGYADHAHFTRAFLGWKGMSPREWRLTGRSSHR
ncbi:AraC family transcriptional regulator ligand-binding domain-containing protein [Ciceribacter azotifigens]|uniref:AraC family transcriptional regulator n=1 Tax=Ciceribacter azotifigens TaxID=2069303 RepID=UPI003A86C171